MSSTSNEITEAVDTAIDEEAKQDSHRRNSVSLLSSTSLNCNKININGSTFDQSFSENSITRYHRERKVAVSSRSLGSLRAVKASSRGAIRAAIAHREPSTAEQEQLVSNVSGLIHIAGTNSTPTNDESDTSTTKALSADRDKNKRSEEDKDIANLRISTAVNKGDGDESVFVNMEKKKQAGESKELRVVSIESSSHSSVQDNSFHDALQSVSMTEMGIEASKARHGQFHGSSNTSEILDGMNVDDDAREAVGTLLGLHDLSSSHLKAPPAAAAFDSLVTSSEGGRGSHKMESTSDSNNGPVKKRRYQKRGADERTSLSEGINELEKKRLASRISSRRTREREKMRGEYFRTIRKKLEKKNRKLREENNHIRSLIKKTKKEITGNKSAPSTLRSATSLQSTGHQIAPLPCGQGATDAMSVPSGLALPSQLQEQEQLVALLMQQLLGQTNSGANNVVSQQNSLLNPTVLALFVAGLQSGNQSQHQIPGILQQLLPIVLASQLSGVGSQQGNNQQAVLQLLSMLIFGAAPNSQQQQQQPQQNPSQSPLVGNVMQATSNQNVSRTIQNGVISSSQLSNLLGGHASVKVPVEGSRASSSLSASVPLPPTGHSRAAPAAPAPANEPAQLSFLGHQPMETMAASTQSQGPSSDGGFGQALLSQLQLQQLATHGQQISPQLQHDLMLWMALQGSQVGQQHPRSSSVETGQASFRTSLQDMLQSIVVLQCPLSHN
jgi:hypothetical protein